MGRCISIMKCLSEKDQSLQVHAFPETHDYLKKNLPQGCELKEYQTGNIQEASKDRIMIHDWRPEVAESTRKSPNRIGPVTVSLYHSRFDTRKGEPKSMHEFKKHIRQVANKTDVFLHMNVTPPKNKPSNMRCLYIPIPNITRGATLSPEEVKKKLGLKEGELFILVQMGSGLGKHRYKQIKKWYRQVDKLAAKYQFVVAGQLKDEDYLFRKNVIQAPLFPNGKDLVQAADLVITKPGMGILGDCISTKTPIIMLPADNPERKQKIQILRRILKSDIGIVKKPDELEQKIEKALANREVFEKSFETIPANGAEVAANIMMKIMEIPRSELKKRKKELLALTPYSSISKKKECK